MTNAIAIKDFEFDGIQLKKGESYRVVDSVVEPTDIFLLMGIEGNGDKGKVIPVDLGDSYAVMTIEPDDSGVSFSTYFELEEK